MAKLIFLQNVQIIVCGPSDVAPPEVRLVATKGAEMPNCTLAGGMRDGEHRRWRLRLAAISTEIPMPGPPDFTAAIAWWRNT